MNNTHAESQGQGIFKSCNIDAVLVPRKLGTGSWELRVVGALGFVYIGVLGR
jgi:hypothetical protein